jgi:hypothetical protein
MAMRLSAGTRNVEQTFPAPTVKAPLGRERQVHRRRRIEPGYEDESRGNPSMGDNKQLERIALLLQIIADELYVARTDKEIEGASGAGPEMWESQGRNYMIRGIEAMREKADKPEVER